MEPSRRRPGQGRTRPQQQQQQQQQQQLLQLPLLRPLRLGFFLAALAAQGGLCGSSGDCGEGVAALQAKVDALATRVEALEGGHPSPQPLRRVAAEGGSGGGSGGTLSAVPDYYKLKQKAPELKYLSWGMWLYVSYEVYAGDQFLGEFRQSMPWVRLLYDVRKPPSCLRRLGCGTLP